MRRKLLGFIERVPCRQQRRFPQTMLWLYYPSPQLRDHCALCRRTLRYGQRFIVQADHDTDEGDTLCLRCARRMGWNRLRLNRTICHGRLP